MFRMCIGDAVVGRFQEVSTVAKLTGLNKSADVTLKRGVIGAPALRDWLKRRGKKTVTIELMTESQAVDVRWVLRGARPAKLDGPDLNAHGGGDVAIEELVLSAERLELLSRAS